MIHGTEVHEGMLLLIDGKIYKVITANLRGSAQVHKIMHLGLKSIPEGHFTEKTYNPGEKVDQILPERSVMQYLYKTGTEYFFMDTTTFEQLAVPDSIVGNIGQYFKENAQIHVEFYSGQPINIVFPKVVRLMVASTAAGIHDGTDSTFKEAVLENGMKILVPQFLKEGDVIEVDTDTGKYIDRVKK
ncbi:MAG: elongation factor P [Candidatus Omnitrophica bacterium]|nr:elongation factor P [Candidatus Omnitrophota bacterium]